MEAPPRTALLLDLMLLQQPVVSPHLTFGAQSPDFPQSSLPDQLLVASELILRVA